MANLLKNKKMLFSLVLLVILLFFGYSLYSIDTTNKYVDSVLKSNYYQGATLNDYLINRIDNELEGIIKDRVNNNDFYAAISFNKSATRSEWFATIFGSISVIFLGLIGVLLWANYRQKERSEKIIDDLEKTKLDAKKMLEDTEKEMKEKIKQVLIKAESEIAQMVEKTRQTQIVSQIRIRHSAERFLKQQGQK